MTDLATWTVNADLSVDFDGRLHFPPGIFPLDPNGQPLTASGAGIIILGPNGGVTNFPAIFKGDVGPAVRLSFQTQQVAYGDTLPSPNPAVTATAFDQYGNPTAMSIVNYLNAGPPGANGSSVILTATDLEGVAAQGKMIGYSTADTKAQWQPKPWANWYYAGSIAATTSNTNAQKQMTSIAVPAQPFDWWPELRAQGLVIGAVDTRVDLVARKNSTSGDICGYGLGASGATPPPITLIEQGLAVGSSNIVPAGDAAVIYLMAENQTASSNPWNTASGAWFQVRPNPVPS